MIENNGYTLYIKNMVCDRCIKVVKENVNRLNLNYISISLGAVVLDREPSNSKLAELIKAIEIEGFEFLNDPKNLLIEKIKSIVIHSIHRSENAYANINYSYLLQNELGKDYHYLSNLFSSSEGITIEKYIILQRIEKVKELLNYNEKNLSEISYLLGYSSVQHLSAQFRKVTGLTPSEYKKAKSGERKTLDQVY